MRKAPRSCVTRGVTPAFCSAERYFALTPNTVMASRSAKSTSAAAVGWNGEPSYNTTRQPVARPETSQFHIIQPQVVK